MLVCSIPSKVFVAVSGGIDSIAAAFYLSKLKHHDIHVLHFNHNYQECNIRMEESVRRFCVAMDLPYSFGTTSSILKTETELRRERMNFFFNNEQNRTVITAHHLGDFVESYLLNCFRGNSNHFTISFVSDFGNGNQILHPFLFKNKSFFETIVEKNNLKQYVVDDPTNNLTKGSRRNMIRHRILPILSEEQVGIEKICRKMILKKLKNEHLCS